MGMWFSKRKSLEFTILPSEEISGPLGLGDPDSQELSDVEKDTLIPALMHDQLRTKTCASLWDDWTKCTQIYYWTSVMICRDLFNKALHCNKRNLYDPEFVEKMTQLYLKMRSEYRRTGVEQKIVRTTNQ